MCCNLTFDRSILIKLWITRYKKWILIHSTSHIIYTPRFCHRRHLVCMIPRILLFESTNFTDSIINLISDPDRSIRSGPIWISNVANFHCSIKSSDSRGSSFLEIISTIRFAQNFNKKAGSLKLCHVSGDLPSCSMTKIIRFINVIRQLNFRSNLNFDSVYFENQ